MKTISFVVSPDVGSVDGILTLPKNARCLYVFAHGAGAGMDHIFMENMAEALANHGVAALRYQFPYMQSATRRPPNRQPVLTATVAAAVEHARRLAPELPLLAGGKSMGGRMTSLAVAQALVPADAVAGLVFLGFPLHPPKKPGVHRAEHLAAVPLPMLFVQGSRDALATPDLLRPELAKLKDRATLHTVEGADHGFAIRKRDLPSPTFDICDHIAQVVAEQAEVWRVHPLQATN